MVDKAELPAGTSASHIKLPPLHPVLLSIPAGPLHLDAGTQVAKKSMQSLLQRVGAA